ncbi:MAG: S41 family peptidase [Lachnospiraceae bacterium]|nr:S41 family peptidase [Lachnospiraceae bacterium]
MNDEKYLSGMITGAVCALALFSVTVFIVALVLGKSNRSTVSYNNVKESETSVTIENSKDKIFGKMELLADIINEYSLYDVPEEDIIEGVYQGMFDSMNDKYADYYTAEEYKQFAESTNGEYCGIGAYIGQNVDTNAIYISEPMEGSPAMEVGLRSGDIIYKVDDKVLGDESLDTVVTWIKGEEGTKVKLTIIREGESDYLEFEVTRKNIEVPTVKGELLENEVGLISISSFDKVTASQFEETVNKLKEQGMKKMIIDLRSNPGGMLDVVVDMLDMFLEPGKMIVYTQDKTETTTEQYKSQNPKVIDMPLVVLINGYSASASEIFAGAIQDYKLGTLVGETSFGKGIVQTVLPVGDGSYVKFTTAKYFTPNGRYIHEVGIEPDEKVEFDSKAYYDENVDNQLNKAKEIINSME